MNEKTKIFFCEDDDNLGLLLKEYLDTKGLVKRGFITLRRQSTTSVSLM